MVMVRIAVGVVRGRAVIPAREDVADRVVGPGMRIDTGVPLAEREEKLQCAATARAEYWRVHTR
jgi:hypothetical protein